MKFLFIFLTFSASMSRGSSTKVFRDYRVVVEGLLRSYDADEVIIEQDGGTRLRLPASALSHKSGLITGKAFVTVSVSPDDLVKRNPFFLKKKK